MASSSGTSSSGASSDGPAPAPAGEAAPALLVEDVWVSYGAVAAVRGISLSLAAGEVRALLGANGAGKTTLLRAVSGLLPLRRGRVVYRGEAVRPASAHRLAGRGLIHVPEGRGLFGQMTVRENLVMGAYARAPRADALEQALDGVLARFPRLAERQRQVAGSLSGGEQQQLAIAKALMGQPRVLLLDEPSLGLAPRLVRDVFAIVAELRAEGLTILLVEQNARQALRVADRAHVLVNGRVELEGSGPELAENEAVLAAYLGRTAATT